MPTTMTIIREDFVKQQQDLLFTRIAETPDGRKFRTKIRRNAYDFQSTACVEVWTPNGWTQVVTLPGAHPVMADLPSYVTNDETKATLALKSVALMLEADAEEVARP